MIGVSVILVALVSSVVIGVVVVLLGSLVVRLTMSIVRRVRDALRQDLAAERSSRPGPQIGVEDDNDQVSVQRTACVVGCLVAASVLVLVGVFLPLNHFHIAGRGGSVTSYSLTPYGALTTWLNLASLLTLGYLAARRRDRIIAAIIVGYCALTLGNFVMFVATLTVRGENFGAGYYLIGIGAGVQAIALVIAIVILVTGRSARGRVTVGGVALGVLAALLGAATSLLNPVKFFDQSIWTWKGLPWQYSIGLVALLLTLVLIPLVATRIADRAAAGMLLGLAAALVLSAIDALLQRLSHPRLDQLTFGFWLTILGVVTLVFLALALSKPFAQRPASTPIPAPVT